LLVLAAGAERDRLEQRAATESGVRVPGVAAGERPHDEVARRSHDAADADPREHQVHLDPERLKRRREQQVLLEAVAAATVAHQLALEIVDRERHPDAAVRVEVLERDRGRVGAVDLRDPRAPAQPNPRQVRVEVEHGR